MAVTVHVLCSARERFIRDKYERALYKLEPGAVPVGHGSPPAQHRAVAHAPVPAPAPVPHHDTAMALGGSSLAGRHPGRRRTSSGNVVIDHLPHATHGGAHVNPAVMRRLAKKHVSAMHAAPGWAHGHEGCHCAGCCRATSSPQSPASRMLQCPCMHPLMIC